MCHPSWPAYEDNVETIDETGARISAAKYRVDVGAIQNIWALFNVSWLGKSHRHPYVGYLSSAVLLQLADACVCP